MLLTSTADFFVDIHKQEIHCWICDKTDPTIQSKYNEHKNAYKTILPVCSAESCSKQKFQLKSAVKNLEAHKRLRKKRQESALKRVGKLKRKKSFKKSAAKRRKIDKTRALRNKNDSSSDDDSEIVLKKK